MRGVGEARVPISIRELWALAVAIALALGAWYDLRARLYDLQTDVSELREDRKEDRRSLQQLLRDVAVLQDRDAAAGSSPRIGHRQEGRHGKTGTRD